MHSQLRRNETHRPSTAGGTVIAKTPDETSGIESVLDVYSPQEEKSRPSWLQAAAVRMESVRDALLFVSGKGRSQITCNRRKSPFIFLLRRHSPFYPSSRPLMRWAANTARTGTSVMS
jgi:hypothetical protein